VDFENFGASLQLGQPELDFPINPAWPHERGVQRVWPVCGQQHLDVTSVVETIQRTMLELVNQLDGFDNRGNIKVLLATNRPDTLDPALVRPGRVDRKIEFGLPKLEGRAKIFKIHANKMNVDRSIRWDLLSRLCPNCTGADIRSVCTEAGMSAIRARKKMCTEKHFLDAIQKVVKEYKKFSATPKYMVYN
jgi:26S proteasome regulatory subunit T1